jgi:hypothetical protein
MAAGIRPAQSWAHVHNGSLAIVVFVDGPLKGLRGDPWSLRTSLRLLMASTHRPVR